MFFTFYQPEVHIPVTILLKAKKKKMFTRCKSTFPGYFIQSYKFFVTLNVVWYECWKKRSHFLSTGCARRPVSGAPTKYEQYTDNGVWKRENCPRGAAYNPADCSCSLTDLIVPGRGKILNMLYIYVRISKKWTWVLILIYRKKEKKSCCQCPSIMSKI